MNETLRERVVANFRARVVKAKGTQQALDYAQMLDWAWDEEAALATPAPLDEAQEFANRAAALARTATEHDPAIEAYALVSIALSLAARLAAPVDGEET